MLELYINIVHSISHVCCTRLIMLFKIVVILVSGAERLAVKNNLTEIR